MRKVEKLTARNVKTNLETVQDIIDYIDANLGEALDLDTIALKTGYSKYHISRMFTGIVGFTLHHYIQRRRLTEAARRLVRTEMPVMDIALEAGYETQQSFTVAFKTLYQCSPQAYRKKGDFYPLQLRFEADGRACLRGDRIMEAGIVDSGSIFLAGVRRNTRFGFFAIGRCWRLECRAPAGFLHLYSKTIETVPLRYATINLRIGITNFGRR